MFTRTRSARSSSTHPFRWMISTSLGVVDHRSGWSNSVRRVAPARTIDELHVHSTTGTCPHCRVPAQALRGVRSPTGRSRRGVGGSVPGDYSRVPNHGACSSVWNVFVRPCAQRRARDTTVGAGDCPAFSRMVRNSTIPTGSASRASAESCLGARSAEAPSSTPISRDTRGCGDQPLTEPRFGWPRCGYALHPGHPHEERLFALSASTVSLILRKTVAAPGPLTAGGGELTSAAWTPRRRDGWKWSTALLASPVLESIHE
jgi:hypothetical protein